MEIRQLKTFRTVAKLMSFHGAAKTLGYAQSTISAQIQGLEDNLGVKVFERVGRSIKLTPAGDALLDYAKKLVDLEQEARTIVSEEVESSASLDVLCSETICNIYLPNILELFFNIYHKLQVSIVTNANGSSRDMLGSEHMDLAVILGEAPASKALAVEEIDQIGLALVVGHKTRLASQLLVSNADLARQALVLATSDNTKRVVEARLLTKGVLPERVVEVGSLSGVLELVAAGQGVAFVPLPLAQREQQEGRVAIVDWEGGAPSVGIHLVHHAGKRLTEPAQAFLNITRQVITE